MSAINHLSTPDEQTVSRLIDIWESAVTKTHTFLSGNDILEIKREVYQGLKTMEKLYGYVDNNRIIRGFIGIANLKIEMLFIDDNARGQGIGKLLLNHAIDNLDAKNVDVNEQNSQAVGFYKHMGFRVNGRSETDGQGRPFPLLYLEL